MGYALHRPIREALGKSRLCRRCFIARGVPEGEDRSWTGFSIRHMLHLFLGAVAATGRLKWFILRGLGLGPLRGSLLGPFLGANGVYVPPCEANHRRRSKG